MEKLKGALVVGFLRLFALLPWRAVQAVGNAIGWLMWKLPNSSRDVVRINLSKCFPELSEAEREHLVGQSLKDIGKTLTESACAWIWPTRRSRAAGSMSGKHLERLIRTVSRERLGVFHMIQPIAVPTAWTARQGSRANNRRAPTSKAPLNFSTGHS